MSRVRLVCWDHALLPGIWGSYTEPLWTAVFLTLWSTRQQSSRCADQAGVTMPRWAQWASVTMPRWAQFSIQTALGSCQLPGRNYKILWIKSIFELSFQLMSCHYNSLDLPYLSILGCFRLHFFWSFQLSSWWIFNCWLDKMENFEFSLCHQQALIPCCNPWFLVMVSGPDSAAATMSGHSCCWVLSTKVLVQREKMLDFCFLIFQYTEARQKRPVLLSISKIFPIASKVCCLDQISGFSSLKSQNSPSSWTFSNTIDVTCNLKPFHLILKLRVKRTTGIYLLLPSI